MLHPYSAIAEETDGENGCYGGFRKCTAQANVTRSRYETRSSKRVGSIFHFATLLECHLSMSWFFLIFFFLSLYLKSDRVLQFFSMHTSLRRTRSFPIISHDGKSYFLNIMYINFHNRSFHYAYCLSNMIDVFSHAAIIREISSS